MLPILITFGLSPTLVGLSTLAATRWGTVVGGVLSAFPAVVGPVLLIAAIEHGHAFAARAADGTLLGLAALGAFVLAYGWVALRRNWGWCLIAGWLAAAVAAAGAGLVGPGAGRSIALLVALGSLALAYVALSLAPRSREGRPKPVHDDPRARWRGAVVGRMAASAALVAGLSLLAGIVGPVVGGMLGALPILVSVLSVSVHRDSGVAALLGLLRGTLVGMIGFVSFCEVLARLLRHSGLGGAFLAAITAAVIAQSLAFLSLARAGHLTRRASL